MRLKVLGARYNIQIGQRSEQNARPVEIDIAPWLEQWPTGLGIVTVKRPGDRQYYVAANVHQDNQERLLIWTPDLTDTEIVTVDKPVLVQVVFSDGDTTLARTPVWECRVAPSLPGTEGTAPEAQTPWITELLQAAATTTANAQAAQQSANAAAESAQQALLRKLDAQMYSNSAAQSAIQSEYERRLAQGAAEQAQQFENSAFDAAHQATDAVANIGMSASAAAESAQRAEQAATRASGSAQTATEKAAESAASLARVVELNSATQLAATEVSANAASVDAQTIQAVQAANYAADSRDRAEAAAVRAESALDDRGIIDFYILSNGHLIQEYSQGSEDIVFGLNNGRLEVAY